MEDAGEQQIRDIWVHEDAQRQLSSTWTGKTCFEYIRPALPMGYEYVQGRPTRVQKTERTPNVLPEVWRDLSKGQKRHAQLAWEKFKPILEAARQKAGIRHTVLDEELPEYNEVMARAKRVHGIRPAPAMPVVQLSSEILPVDRGAKAFAETHPDTGYMDLSLPHIAMGAYPTPAELSKMLMSPSPNSISTLDRGAKAFRFNESSNPANEIQSVTQDLMDITAFTSSDRGAKAIRCEYGRHHDEINKLVGQVSHEWFVLVHKPISIDKAMKIPKAAKAVNSEWESLFGLEAFDLKSVRPRSDVAAEALRTKTPVHFGSLMDLCHEKHAEFNLPEEEKVYKGRGLLRDTNQGRLPCL